MRRDQLEHAIRTSCQIIDAAEVIVVGSQAILGAAARTAMDASAASYRRLSGPDPLPSPTAVTLPTGALCGADRRVG